MAALVREAEASSESLAAFARRHGIREQTWPDPPKRVQVV